MNKIIDNSESSLKPKLLEKIIKASQSKLNARYSSKADFIFTKRINELVFNEDSAYTCKFKEFLVYEDYNEFLKKYYLIDDGLSKLKRITLFYNQYSKTFPNYVILPESKIFYRNIQKKQKMIDNLQEMKKEEENQSKRIRRPDYKPIKILNTSIQNSIFNNSNSFAINLKDIFNGGNDKDGNDEDANNKYSDDKYITLVNKVISQIEELQKKNEEKKIIVKIISLNKKSKIEKSELKKFHSLNPEKKPKQNVGIVIKNKKQNASGSTHATSFLSTLNNHTKEKPKCADKQSKEYSYLLSNCILNKNNSMIAMNPMSPMNNQDGTHVCSKNNRSSNLLNNSAVNFANSSVSAQNKTVTFNQNPSNQGKFSDRIPAAKPLNFSKINIQSIKTKLKKKMLEAEYWTHRSHQKSQIDILKVNNSNDDRKLLSRNSLLSHLSKSLQNIQRNNNANNLRHVHVHAHENQAQVNANAFQQNNNSSFRMKNNILPSHEFSKPSYFSDSGKKFEEHNNNNYFNHKPVASRHVHQSKLTRGKYRNKLQGFINKN